MDGIKIMWQKYEICELALRVVAKYGRNTYQEIHCRAPPPLHVKNVTPKILRRLSRARRVVRENVL